MSCTYPISTLRTGYCPLLNSYLSRIRINVDKLCPKCEVAPHDVHQIFNCSKDTTDMKVIELWEKPVEVANRLYLLSYFPTRPHCAE